MIKFPLLLLKPTDLVLNETSIFYRTQTIYDSSIFFLPSDLFSVFFIFTNN